MQYIAFDSHKKYTFASAEDQASGKVFEKRIDHERGALREYLARFDPGSPVAVETIGNWYWIVEEIEAAGMKPQLVHARKAKLMMSNGNKTDKLDARGMNRLQKTGTLPTVWIPDAALRDKRELFRTRMVLTRQRVQIKNRIHATLSKYAIRYEQTGDLFGKTGRAFLEKSLEHLPLHTRFTVQQMLSELDLVEAKIEAFESRMQEVFAESEDVKLLRTIPGIGFILAVVIASEIGDVFRFPSSAHFASYAGTTPRVHASGGKVHYGQVRSDVNRYLKWAFAEAANTVCQLRRRWTGKHVSVLYNRVRLRRGHQTAIGAVSRHLAESVYWVLRKREPYRDPNSKSESVSSTKR